MSELFLYAIDEHPERAVTYLVGTGDEVFGVDPGQPFPVIREALERFRKTCCGVLLTHGHFDHIESLDSFCAPVYIHSEDEELLRDPVKNVSYLFGCSFQTDVSVTKISEETVLPCGKMTVRVLHTPGHTRGSVCYLCSVGEEELLLSGDTLFCGNVGRWDFPGGNAQTLLLSLKRLTQMLPVELRVYPGHGESTVIGHEKRTNYFLIGR